MLNSTSLNSPRLSADLDAALLGRTDLSHAQPIKAYLEFAYLDSAKLREADLYSASLSGADLDSANLSAPEGRSSRTLATLDRHMRAFVSHPRWLCCGTQQ
jgi:uncharacterized protein YjbI with pentapeptide repeats